MAANLRFQASRSHKAEDRWGINLWRPDSQVLATLGPPPKKNKSCITQGFTKLSRVLPSYACISHVPLFAPVSPPLTCVFQQKGHPIFCGTDTIDLWGPGRRSRPKPATPCHFNQVVQQVLLLTVQAVRKHGSLALALMDCCACLGPTDIPTELLSLTFEDHQEEEVLEQLVTLQGYGLLRLNRERKTVHMPNYLQSLLCEVAPWDHPAGLALRLVRALAQLMLVANADRTTHTYRAQFLSMVPHLEELTGPNGGGRFILGDAWRELLSIMSALVAFFQVCTAG